MTTTADESRVGTGEALGFASEFLSDIGRRISARVADLSPLLRAEAVEAERAGALTDKSVAALHDAGVFHLATPIEYGGYAVGARDLLEVLKSVARGDGSAAWLAAAASGNNVMVLAYPQQAVDEVYADLREWVGPPLVGASVFATKVGAARRVDGGWLVRGKWGFGSGCKHAAWAMVGVDFERSDGREGRGQVLLERDQYVIIDDWHVSGLGATSSNTITTQDEVFVPEHRFLDMAEYGDRTAALRGRYAGAGFTWGAQARVLAVMLSSAANALGMAQGALECFVEQAKARKPFNLPYPTVAEMPSTQVTAGKVRAMINVAEATIERHAEAIDRRSLAGADFTPGEATQGHGDLVYAMQLCAQAADAVQIALGSSTVSLKNPIQRFARDLRVLTTHGAIRSDPMAEINGRDVLGLPPFPMFAGGLPDRG